MLQKSIILANCWNGNVAVLLNMKNRSSEATVTTQRRSVAEKYSIFVILFV